MSGLLRWSLGVGSLSAASLAAWQPFCEEHGSLPSLTGVKHPEPGSALATSTRGVSGDLGPTVCQHLLTPHPTVLSCSLPHPQKHRNIPEESTNKWKQRVKTAMAGVKLVLFYFGGNASLDCLQTTEVHFCCVFFFFLLNKLYFC